MPERDTHVPPGRPLTLPPGRDAPRIDMVAGGDRACADLVALMIELAVAALPFAYLGGKFAQTVRRGRGPEGVSVRYSVIATMGLRALAVAEQRRVLGGDDCDHVLGLLAAGLEDMTSRGDVALVCWAAAEAGHSALPRAIDRLRTLDKQILATGGDDGDQLDVVSAAWIVTALIAARAVVDVEQHLAAARRRLLGARRCVFPHLIGGEQPWYRAHVGSFADQIYPVQALARLHASADDPGALEVAERVAGVVTAAQGPAGQWWWHYDARNGDVVEGYPVYSVHQHAMAPMALLDLASAGGEGHLAAIRRGIGWLAAPPETGERLIAEDVPVIWRKVGRGDRRKLVRGIAAASTAIRPGKPSVAGRLFPPGVVDYECRPYELGWLLYAWLSGARS